MKKFLVLSFVACSLLAQESTRKMLASNLLEHTQAQFRVGYIIANGESDEQAYGVGGHIHFDTKKYQGLSASMRFDTLQHFGLPHENGDFYGDRKEGFSFVSVAKFQYDQEKFHLEAGRLTFDSPHADSDDIRMVPNFFEGVVINYDNFTLAHISKMAGWESGGDISSFKPLYKLLGSNQKSDGMNVVGYEGERFSIWGYNIDEIANVLYAQINLEQGDFHIAFQGDIARSTGKKLAGDIQSTLLGVLIEYSMKDLTFMAAANKEFDEAAMFSFGGGPFFTSLEDQTIDMAGKDAKSYTLGLEYGLGNVNLGAVYGEFKGENYHTKESDLYISTEVDKNIELESVFATIDDKFGPNYSIFRVIISYNF